VYMIVGEDRPKPKRRLPETIEKLGLQCDVSVKVCVVSRGEVEMYLGFSINKDYARQCMVRAPFLILLDFRD